MKVIRRGVFETNSSSSHSLSIDYLDDNADESLLAHNLPRIPKSVPTKVIDIQKVHLIQDGYAFGEVDKLRIFIALISELIYDEYRVKLRVEWESKNPKLKHDWNAWYEYWNKKATQKGTYRYFLEHRYLGYINAVLKSKCNLKIEFKPLFNYPPYISYFIDNELGCETSGYYRDIGIRSDMNRDSFKRILENIVFNPTIALEQYTSERNE